MKLIFKYAFLACLLAACNHTEQSNTSEESTQENLPLEITEEKIKILNSEPGKAYTVAFYNVENLFDTYDDPKTQDEDFLPSNKERSWTEERYQEKLKNLAEVISQLGDEDGPELLGVCEVENKAVLEALVAEKSIKARNYGIVHFESADGRGIDNALLYKKDHFQVTKATNYVVTFPMEPNYDTRDIVLVRGELLGQPMALLVNHWPSRRGGEEESEGRRLLVASKVKAIVEQLQKEDASLPIIIMGDFNDEPHNQSIQKVLQAKGKEFDSKKGELFNTMLVLDVAGMGTYKYHDDWNMLDQIIISGALTDGQGWDYQEESASIFSPEWLKQQSPEKYKGSPLRTFGGSKYLGGYSDHFPIYIHLSTK